MSVDTRAWTHLGSTRNAEMYAVAPDVLAVVPHDGCHDDDASARESLDFQEVHWRRLGHRGAAVVFMDAVVEQDGGARAVYAAERPGFATTCFALVGETFFGQAVSAVFTGLARPAIPTEVFPSLEAALPWIARMNRERGGPL